MGLNELEMGCDLELMSVAFLSRKGDQIALIHFRDWSKILFPPDLGHGLLSKSASARVDTLEALDGVAVLFDYDVFSTSEEDGNSGIPDSSFLLQLLLETPSLQSVIG